MKYKFKYKRRFFFKTIKNVIGHNFDLDSNRMDIFLDHKIISIPKWSECEMVLGSDFLLKQKEDIKKESGVR